MNFNIVILAGFEKELKKLAKKYPSIKNDFAGLLEMLKTDPKLGTAIGRNCYKIRLAITSKGKGKSGGARIITHFLVTITDETLYLLKVYDKGDQESISETELKYLLNTINKT